MMYPILCKVRYESLHRVFNTRQIWIQIVFSIFVNWIIAPFFMVSLQGYDRCLTWTLTWNTLVGVILGFPSRRTRATPGADSGRISTMHRYGTYLPPLKKPLKKSQYFCTSRY